ncbi:MAG TPA: protoporphyrinogen oxidase, partial [Geobacteraceae bacterium]|nr:protoporphyrinogen oxidase [Geobacteraceae bacterium]
MKRAIVIGGGISGLASAFFLRKKAREQGLELEVKVLEKGDRPGGKIRSIRDQGYLCEWGPNGFLDSKPQTLDLCADLKIEGRLLRSNDNARKRYILSDGRLHRLPENGVSFFASKLISWPGKIRLALEPFAPARPESVDETLAAFGRRRLGNEALRKLIAPMVSGVFAGNPETMSLKSCFPRIAELESEYGGLIMAMIRLARKKRRERAQGKVVSSPSGPGGILTSFREGIQELINAAAENLGPDVVVTGQEVMEVARVRNGSYRVRTDDRELVADLVVVAAPSYAAAEIVRNLSGNIADL